MFPKLKGKQSAGSKSSKDEADNGNDKNPSLLYADRSRLLHRAKRHAANGNMDVCDRYPTEIVGAMDSPRLESCEGRRNWKGRLLNRLATIEQRLYRDVPAPDLVLRLQVTLERSVHTQAGRSVQTLGLPARASGRMDQAAAAA